jgi:hypothetical protein
MIVPAVVEEEVADDRRQADPRRVGGMNYFSSFYQPREIATFNDNRVSDRKPKYQIARKQYRQFCRLFWKCRDSIYLQFGHYVRIKQL